MTPVAYQNRAGVESLWASQTVLLNYPNGPTAVRWYQFNVTGGNFPATPVQQQSWNNGNDSLWRWMPSIAVDQNGNTAIGYSTSSATQEPSIRYAGRMAADPLNNLAQGEAIMTVGGGHQTHSSGRWGDYSITANWRSVSGATGYRLDVATDSSFVNYVPGYQDLDAGNTTSYNVTGLAANTIYYYRVRAYNGNGTSPNSKVVHVKTRNH